MIAILKHDPLAVLRSSRTPAGLYALSRWLAQGHDRAWQIDCDKKIEALRKGQLKKGSWADFPLLTAGRLFDLELTLREPHKHVGGELNG